VPHCVYTGRAKSRTFRLPRRQCGTLCLRFTYRGKAGRFTCPGVSTPGTIQTKTERPQGARVHLGQSHTYTFFSNFMKRGYRNPFVTGGTFVEELLTTVILVCFNFALDVRDTVTHPTQASAYYEVDKSNNTTKGRARTSARSVEPLRLSRGRGASPGSNGAARLSSPKSSP
jgi:hypothetical protein